MTDTVTVTPKNDSLALALAAAKRGLYNEYIDLVPLDDDGKEIVKGLPAKLLDLPRTEESIRLLMAAYPTAPVGIRGRRGVGGIFVIDIDQPGVIERIEKETGQPFPKTYMTQTRPQTKPWKIHAYFEGTEDSVSLVEKQRYCGEYDLKCCGGAGHVAAEGCWRPSGGGIFEQITGNGLPFIKLPYYLLKFLDSDSRRLMAEKVARDNAVKKEISVLNDTGEKRTTLIPVGDRRRHLRSIAGTLYNALMPRDRILKEIRLQCQSDCEDGMEWSKTPEGREALRKIAFDKTLKRRPRRVREFKPEKPVEKRMVIEATPSVIERARQLEVIRGFASRVTSAHAYAAVGLDKSKRGDQGRLRDLMRDGGFAPTPDGRSWERLMAISPMETNHTIVTLRRSP